MKQLSTATGQDLREMFSAATAWLEKSAADVDAINVFPVPDGDTGTNMLLTMRSTMEEAYRTENGNASAVSKAMAYGALMGARGNSGVILSQILRGISKSFEDKEAVTGPDFAAALAGAADLAYKGLSHPVEGTILTVSRDVAAAAKEAAAANPNDFLAVVDASVKAAQESVARTPTLLPVLREAGVVDAGGEGLYIILEGIQRHLKGETAGADVKARIIAPNLESAPPAIQLAEDEEPYGYCTEFLIEGRNLNLADIKRKLLRKGQSLIVVGDENNVRVHIHSLSPGGVLLYVTSLGVLHHIKIQNMDDQHREFVEMQKAKMPTLDIAVIAVAAGDGMKEVFRSLGAASIVHGGQTMNPSVRDILRAVETAPSNKVILLPNNKNIVMAASQIQPLTQKQVRIVPTRTMAQGVAALLAFKYEGDLEDNFKTMTKAIASVKTIEITTAVRSTRLNGLQIKAGQIIAIVDDQDLVAAGDDTLAVIAQALDKAPTNSVEVATVYNGEGTQQAEAEAAAAQIRRKYPGIQVETVNGGQPHYKFMISLE